MNAPASVQIVKPELPPLPVTLFALVNGKWVPYSLNVNDFDFHMKHNPDKTWAIVEPTAPRKPMSDVEIRDAVLKWIGSVTPQLYRDCEKLIRAVEAHHGIGREDGK